MGFHLINQVRSFEYTSCRRGFSRIQMDRHNTAGHIQNRPHVHFGFEGISKGFISTQFPLLTPVFVKILQKNWLGVFLSLKNLSRGFAPTLRYPRIFF